MPRFLTGACLLVALYTLPAVEVPEDVVGGLDLNRLDVVISDGPTYPADEVATALREDPVLVPAAHFFAPRRDLLRILGERCAIGYQAHGFPAPQVSATVRGRGPAARLIVQVTEGTRLRLGTVKISDHGPVSEEALRQRLCAPWRAPDAKADADPDKPIIVSGEPAPFDEIWKRNLVRTISDFYALQGFQDCKPVVRWSDPHDGVVDCLISFTAAPRAMVVNSVKVTGVKRNRPEAVAAWLASNAGLRVDGPGTMAVMTKARQALNNSGRFFAITLTTTPVPDQAERIDVVVKALDSERLPALDQPLSAIQQGALTWRETVLGDLEKGALSFIVTMRMPDKKTNAAFLLNPLRGCALRLTSLDPMVKVDATLGFSDKRLFYVSHHLGRASTVAWDVQPLLTLSLETKDDPAQPHSFSFYISTQSEPQEKLTDITVSPSFILSQINGAEFVGNKLVAKKGNSIATLDLDGDPAFSMAGVEEGDEMRCLLTRTPWTELLQQTTGKTEKELLTLTPQGGPALMHLLIDDLLPPYAKYAGANEAALRLWLTAGVTLASSWWQSLGPKDESREKPYHIPVDLPPEQMIPLVVNGLRRMILDHTKDSWPSSSWPMLIINETSAVVNGHHEHTREVLTHLVDDKVMGPLGHVALSGLLQYFDPRLSRVVAGLGESHLNADEWAQDLVTLVPRLPPVRTVLLAFVDPEAAALALPENQRATFIDLVQRAKRDLTPAEEQALLRDVARLTWQAGGDEMMRGWLQSLQREPAASGAPPP